MKRRGKGVTADYQIKKEYFTAKEVSDLTNLTRYQVKIIQKQFGITMVGNKFKREDVIMFINSKQIYKLWKLQVKKSIKRG